MNVVLFGATGMVGQGALRECLLDDGVHRVLAVGRAATGRHHEKLREVVVPDVADLSAVESELVGYDACLFCLGVTSAGMTDTEYTRLTHDLTVAVATTLLRLNPAMTFVFVSGTGADSSERGGMMWARVKGKAENAILRMGFAAAYVFRPAAIIPMHGITSRTRWIRVANTVLKPVFPVLKALLPRHVTTTEQLGRAMLKVARNGFATQVIEARDIGAM
jgi:uncharacterized protein YbjT (DUF2867 family)